MRLSLRFIIPLAFVLAALAYGVVPLADQLTLRWFVRDIDIRSSLVANAVQDPIIDSVNLGSRVKIYSLFNKIIQDQRLYALGYCAEGQAKPLATKTYPAGLSCDELARYESKDGDHLLESAQGPLHVSVKTVEVEGTPIGKIVLLHDMSFIERRSEETKRYVFYFFIVLGTVVSLLTVVIAQLSWRGWVQGTGHATRRGPRAAGGAHDHT